MATEMEFVPYKDFVESLDEASDFASTDKSVVSNSTNGPRAMPQTTADKLVAQRTLAGNLAPAFVPNSTTTVAGLPYMYDGSLYVAKEAYQGAWDANKFKAVNLNEVMYSKYAARFAASGINLFEMPVLNYKGEQANVNVFDLVIPIPSDERQWLNKDACCILDGYISSGGGGSASFNSGSKQKTAILRIKGNATYTISALSTINRFDVAVFSSMPSSGSSTNVRISGAGTIADGRIYYTINCPDDYTYLAIYFYNSDVDTDSVNEVLSTLAVSSANTHSLEAYYFNRLDFEKNNKKESTFTEESVWPILKNIASGLLLSPECIEDVTSSFDLDYKTGKYINANHVESTTSQTVGITDYIAVDKNNVYVLFADNIIGSAWIVEYYDASKAFISGIQAPSGQKKDGFFIPIVPPAGCKYYRISVNYDISKIYRASVDVVSSKVNSFNLISAIIDDMDIEYVDDVTNEYPLNTSAHARLDVNGRVVSSSGGYVSDLFHVDFSEKLVVDSNVDQYGTCVAWYKDPDGVVLDSIYPLPESSKNVRVRLAPPLTAVSFRLCSRSDSYYAVHTYKYVAGSGSTDQLEERVGTLESEMSDVQTEVAQLAESAMLSDVIDTVNAVKYVPKIVLYLGAEVFAIASVTYDSNFWAVDSVEGTITFLGGSNSSPLVLDIALDNGAKYLFRATASDYVSQTDMLKLSIGDGFKVDTYNGSDSLVQGAVSDGGKLKLWPIKSSNTFTLSNISLRKKVPQDSSDTSIELNTKNVNNGNDALSNCNAYWNVALGPTDSTQAKAISLTRSIAIGYAAQAFLESGWQNIAIGTFSLDFAKNGNRNIAIGCDCIYRITHPEQCIAIGKGALQTKSWPVSWDDPSTWQHVDDFVVIGTFAGLVRPGQTASRSVYIGPYCGWDGVGNQAVCIGYDISGTYNKTNVIALGYRSIVEKDNQAVLGNSGIEETKVFGDLVVEGSDHVKRRIVFNNDNTCSWETVN